LAEVNAGRVDVLCDINPIVDDEGKRGILTNARHRAGPDQDVLDATVLLPKLNTIGSAPNRHPGQLGVGVLLLEVVVGEYVQSADVLRGRGRRVFHERRDAVWGRRATSCTLDGLVRSTKS
jgi:hypothetical protein